MTTIFKPLTKDDIADVLGVSLRTIENWVNDGTVPAPKRLGNRVYWHPIVFYGWLEQRLTVGDDNADQAGAGAGNAPPQVAAKVKKPKQVKTELDRLRMRETAKLDALLT